MNISGRRLPPCSRMLTEQVRNTQNCLREEDKEQDKEENKEDNKEDNDHDGKGVDRRVQVKDIIEVLEREIPSRYAVEWDNVGLLVGDRQQEVTRVLIALDATDEVIAHAAECGAQMILTHHPLLFRPPKQVVEQDFLGRRIRALIKHEISCFAMHTNFDIVKMADANAEQLALQKPEVLEAVGEDEAGSYGFGRVGELKEEMTLENFARKVGKVMCLPAVRVYGDPLSVIRRAAVSSGAGKSSIPDAIACGADVIVTGDVDYHAGTDAVMQGISVIDAGHYGTEFVFISKMKEIVEKKLPEIEIETEAICQPYHVLSV